MPDALRDRVQLKRLFLGHFGEFTDLYDNFTVEGETSGDMNHIGSVFGMYEFGPNLRFYDLAATTMDAYWFLARIPGYEFGEQYASVLAAQRAKLYATHPDWQDEEVQSRIWRDTQEEFTDMGLPVSFFSHQVGLDGTASVVFWSPRLVPADAMLKAFQLAVAKVSPA